MLAYIGAGAALFNILVTLIGGMIFVVRLEGKINVQSVHITALQKTSELASAFSTTLAVTNQRIDQIDKTLDDLKRGDGFIVHRREQV